MENPPKESAELSESINILLNRIDALESKLKEPEPEKKTVKNLFSGNTKLRSKHTSTQFSFRTIIWLIGILAIPAYGLYAINYHPPSPHQVIPVTATVTPFGLVRIIPTNTEIPYTPTPEPSRTPTDTPTLVDTPFISELYVAIKTVYPKTDSLTTSGVNWRSVVDYGLGCPAQWPLGSKVLFKDENKTYICVDRYPKLAACDGTLCTVYLFTNNANVPSGPRLARVETLPGH